MKRRTWLAALTAWAARAQDAIIKVDVRLVRLLVTVKNRAGKPVGTLEKQNFRVFDNGVEQQVAVFERSTQQALSVALLMDISGSTAKDLRYEINSLGGFLRALFKEGNPEDRAALYTFNWEVTRQVSFTRRAERIMKALGSVKPEAGTALYDAVYLCSRDLEDRDGRKVIIIVTDGGDTTSGHPFREALAAAHAADAVVYPILVVPIQSEAGRNVGGENALQMFATGTGGRVFSPRIGQELDQAFRQILSDLRTQYLLGYYPKNLPYTKEKFHAVKVELEPGGEGLQVLTRNGYYGEAG